MTRRQTNTARAGDRGADHDLSLGIGQDKPKLGYKDTPMLPGGKWHVHDGDRPQPPVIDPGTRSTQEQPGRPPPTPSSCSTARTCPTGELAGDRPAAWKIEEGALVIKPGAGDLISKDEFGDCQLHLEFAAPVPAPGSRPRSRQ